MAEPVVLPRALNAGLLSGALAAALAVLPSLWFGVVDTRPAEYAALLAVLVGTHLGLRAATATQPTASFKQRLVAAAVIALSACLILGVALYALYALWRPALLAARYERLLEPLTGRMAGPRAVAQLADLSARQAQHLDPLYQAVSGAVTPLFFALLLGGYSVFRWRVAQRLRAGRPGR